MMIEKDSIKPLAILLTQKEVKYWKLRKKPNHVSQKMDINYRAKFTLLQHTQTIFCMTCSQLLCQISINHSTPDATNQAKKLTLHNRTV